MNAIDTLEYMQTADNNKFNNLQSTYNNNFLDNGGRIFLEDEEGFLLDDITEAIKAF
jgi:hypothetical protein